MTGIWRNHEILASRCYLVNLSVYVVISFPAGYTIFMTNYSIYNRSDLVIHGTHRALKGARRHDLLCNQMARLSFSRRQAGMLRESL